MGVNISKTTEASNLSHVSVALAWTKGWVAADLDLSALLLDRTGRLPDARHFVFYNNLGSPNAAVTSHGDDIVGGGNRDNETISIDLERVDPSIVEILICASIHDAAANSLNFGQIERSHVRLVNSLSSTEVHRCELDEDFSTSTAVEYGRLLRVGRNWQFEYVGRGHNGGLEGIVHHYAPNLPIRLMKGGRHADVAGARPADCDPGDMFAQLIQCRPFQGYCDGSERDALLREGMLIGLDRAGAEVVLDLELERQAIVNEHALLKRLDTALRQFTDNDKKLDDKERRDALQLACRPAAGYGSGLRYDVAENYVVQFCRANRVKVKVGFLKWAVP
jgi:tellurium resistance protein TerD